MDYDDEIFPFDSISEARDFFDKCAKAYVAKMLQEVSKHKPSIKQDFAKLKSRDYCIRLIYVLDMFASGSPEESMDSEFDMDWALLFARPSSISQARSALKDLVRIGLIDEIALNDDDEITFGEGTDYHKKARPPENGGEAGPRSKFDFDD